MLKRIFTLILSFFVLLLTASCADQSNEVYKEIYALDTVITVKAYGDDGDAAVQNAEGEIRRLEALFSVTNAQSDVSRLNGANGAQVRISADTYKLLSQALEVSAMTDGLFDPTVYSVLKLWGFTTDSFNVASEAEISQALKTVDYNNISLREENGEYFASLKNGATLDLGGIAKGYISQRATEAVEASGVQSAVLSLGGSIQTLGLKQNREEWKIGVIYPFSEENFAVISMRDASAVTSGAYQRNFEQDGNFYHHIIDPRTGKPAASGIKSCTIISKDPTLADGLSTALYIAGEDKAIEIYRGNKQKFDFIILTEDDEALVTEGVSQSVEFLTDNIKATVIS